MIKKGSKVKYIGNATTNHIGKRGVCIGDVFDINDLLFIEVLFAAEYESHPVNIANLQLID